MPSSLKRLPCATLSTETAWWWWWDSFLNVPKLVRGEKRFMLCIQIGISEVPAGSSYEHLTRAGHAALNSVIHFSLIISSSHDCSTSRTADGKLVFPVLGSFAAMLLITCKLHHQFIASQNLLPHGNVQTLLWITGWPGRCCTALGSVTVNLYISFCSMQPKLFSLCRSSRCFS